MTDDWRFSVIDSDVDAGWTVQVGQSGGANKVDQVEDSDADTGLPKGQSGTLRFGSEIKVDTIKYEGSDDKGVRRVYKGPSAGLDFGLILTDDEKRVAAMAEVSAGSATLNSGANGEGNPMVLNFNANTGLKVGSDGVKFALFGFGATLGYKGVYSVDTPLGSIHSADTSGAAREFRTYATRT